MTQPQDNDSLDERLRRLEPEAFEEMVSETRDTLWRLAIALSPSRALAEELMQDCYLKAYESLERGKWDGLHPNAWHKTVLTRMAIRRSQRQGRLRQLLARFHDPTRSEDQGAASEQLPKALRVHLEALPITQRVAFILHAIDEASVKEIASIMDKTEGSVEQLLHRARKRLKSRISDDT